MPIYDPDQLADWTGGAWRQRPCEPIRRIVHDSRALKPGDLYVALKGERFDGHRFVNEALTGGAAAAIVEAGREVMDRNWPVLEVSDTFHALRQCAAEHRRRVDVRVIGITGSVGKTTVKEMIADVLSLRGTVTRTYGNWNNHIGLPLSLLALELTDVAGVFEVATNHPGEIADLSDLLKPDWAVMTGIGPAHLEYFGTVKAIAEEKADLLRALPPDGRAFLNRDSEWFDLFKEAAPCPVITVSMQNRPADFVGRPGARAMEELAVKERGLGQEHRYTMPLPGHHIMQNALLAIAVARTAGLEPERIEGALSVFTPLDMRWSRADAGGLHFINDAYNANPTSMRAALETFAGIETTGRKWVVLAGMNELGDTAETWHREIGKVAAVGPWEGLLFIGPHAEELSAGAREAGWPHDRLAVCPAPCDAAGVLLQKAEPGDMVLLKASRSEHLEEVMQCMENTQ